MPLPKIPQLLTRKIYKTGQTRGADDDEIFQNRVGRNSTALIPFSQFGYYFSQLDSGFEFENGYIVLISPDDYFSSDNFDEQLTTYGLELGRNAVVFYQTRKQWNENSPTEKNWQPASSRIAPLGGQYVARIAATTATENGGRINEGFITTSSKGAGIRVYEYASLETIQACRLQLEALYWMCRDAEEVSVSVGMSAEDVARRKSAILEECASKKLLEYEPLEKSRMINSDKYTVCPLCLEELSAAGFMARMEQAMGREVHDLTITQVNLFHVEELKFGKFNHRPYNLGWGHHHCNVVVKDAGIHETLGWMAEILDRNKDWAQA